MDTLFPRVKPEEANTSKAEKQGMLVIVEKQMIMMNGIDMEELLSRGRKRKGFGEQSNMRRGYRPICVTKAKLRGKEAPR